MGPAFTTTLEEGRAGCAHFTDEKREEGPSLAQGCVTRGWWSRALSAGLPGCISISGKMCPCYPSW